MLILIIVRIRLKSNNNLIAYIAFVNNNLEPFLNKTSKTTML